MIDSFGNIYHCRDTLLGTLHLPRHCTWYMCHLSIGVLVSSIIRGKKGRVQPDGVKGAADSAYAVLTELSVCCFYLLYSEYLLGMSILGQEAVFMTS